MTILEEIEQGTISAEENRTLAEHGFLVEDAAVGGDSGVDCRNLAKDI